jgi:hypothetical protein
MEHPLRPCHLVGRALPALGAGPAVGRSDVRLVPLLHPLGRPRDRESGDRARLRKQGTVRVRPPRGSARRQRRVDPRPR